MSPTVRPPSTDSAAPATATPDSHGFYEERILRLPAVCALVGLSPATIYRRLKARRFPRPLKLGGGSAIGWLAYDIRAWLQACRDESISSEER